MQQLKLKLYKHVLILYILLLLLKQYNVKTASPFLATDNIDSYAVYIQLKAICLLQKTVLGPALYTS